MTLNRLILRPVEGRALADEPYAAVEILVDARSLREWLPADPGDGPDSPRQIWLDVHEASAALSPPPPGTQRHARLMSCRCGTPGCGDLELIIRGDARHVRWTDLRDPHGPDRRVEAIGPFVFEREAYRHQWRGIT